MVDVAEMVAPRARQRTDLLNKYGLTSGAYLLITAHRAGNVDHLDRLESLVSLLLNLPEPAVFPLHPRTHERLKSSGLLGKLEDASHLTLTPPLGYLDFMTLLQNARAVMTDSGGVQKEAYLAGIGCVTMRSTTEWTETVETGWNELVDLDLNRALTSLQRTLPQERPQLYGDGRAGERVVAAIERYAIQKRSLGSLGAKRESSPLKSETKEAVV
jgi:UDP-N-acetylglucosamine 2-epimerase (non-hydrolysing)/UDP-GlcNAc3NAcA epimerase